MKLAYLIASGIFGGVSVAGFLIWLNDKPGGRYALVASIACFVAQAACMYAADGAKERAS